MKEAKFEYTAPAMDEVDMSANAYCYCSCPCLEGGGSGGGSGRARRKDVDDILDDYYRELRRRLEQLKEEYPDYQHPDLEDAE